MTYIMLFAVEILNQNKVVGIFGVWDAEVDWGHLKNMSVHLTNIKYIQQMCIIVLQCLYDKALTHQFMKHYLLLIYEPVFVLVNKLLLMKYSLKYTCQSVCLWNRNINDNVWTSSTGQLLPSQVNSFFNNKLFSSIILLIVVAFIFDRTMHNKGIMLHKCIIE